MTITDPNTHPSVEIEVKFSGAESHYRRIVDWLGNEGGFLTDSPLIVNRLHIYLDSDGVMERAGCSLRCVIAAGEWYRYDFKAPGIDPDETLELSVRRASPIPITVLIDELLGKIPDDRARKVLSEVRSSARVVLVMTGTHQKTIARRAELEVEVSWDVLISIDSGLAISEIEIELRHGERKIYDAFIQQIEKALGLTRVHMSKYKQALAKESLSKLETRTGRPESGSLAH